MVWTMCPSILVVVTHLCMLACFNDTSMLAFMTHIWAPIRSNSIPVTKSLS
jgi:hypothetical protein